MRNAIESIFSELQNQGISFDNLRPELQKIVLRNLNHKNSDKVCQKIVDISIDIITVGFDKEKLFSGNIDVKKIKKIAQEYGFSPKTKIDSSDILKVKDNRNELAHGMRTFGEVGKEITADKLMEIKNKVVEYLRQILENIEIYLDNKEYLDSSTNTP